MPAPVAGAVGRSAAQLDVARHRLIDTHGLLRAPQRGEVQYRSARLASWVADTHPPSGAPGPARATAVAALRPRPRPATSVADTAETRTEETMRATRRPRDVGGDTRRWMANSVDDGPAQLPLDELVASRSTAYEMVRSGALRCVRIGRRIVVPPSAVAEVWRRAPELPLAQ